MTDQPKTRTQISHLQLSNDKTKIQVTTIGKLGSIGMGYKTTDGNVWQTTGSYWAVLASENIDPMVRYIEDNGDHYMREMRRLFCS